MQFLKEYLEPKTAMITEMKVGNDLYLSGIMMQAECINGNGRKYAKTDMERVVKECQERIKSGNFIAGELNHPDNLSINLANVSHLITEMRMDGNNVLGKMKILNTPSGNIIKGLVEGGLRIGVSSRGAGNVTESGDVSGFAFTTVDAVYQPSAPDAYPNVIREALENNKVLTLAEAMVQDPKAQSFFKKEMKMFLESLSKR